ncbi:hypothetical protein [Vampirovibrio chlorellavorus]|uniref:hypothetical protein n=1 Tax=Vampirovibrio chlorellavorus TaxID=758823 RepID=UPI0026F28BCC|nr:hypothetical protein [Vampirovibrio chlorellavorus]
MPPVETQIAKVPLVLQKMPFWEKSVGNLLHLSEGQNGLSWMSFIRDTSVAWLPKLVVSRSLIEISESTFLEFLESGVVYFSVPVAAQGMHKFFRRQAEKSLNQNLSKEYLGHSVAKLTELAEKAGHEGLKKELPHLVAVKAATILGPMVAVGLGCEYLINYSKNLMTAHFFKKDKFSDIVNLSKGEMKTGEESQVVKKSLHRTLATLGLMGGTLLGSVALAKFGHRLPQKPLAALKQRLLSSPRFGKLGRWVPENPVGALVDHLDYDAKKGGFSISGKQLRWYMAASIPAYADAARDKLERVEAVSRLGVIMGYLAFGQQALERGMLAVIKKFRRELYDAMVAPVGPSGKKQVMRLQDVVERAFSKANAAQGNQVVVVDKVEGLLSKADEAAAKIAADAQLKKAVLGKNVLFGVPMVVGILGTGVGVTLLNQFWTKYRFDKAQQPMPLRNASPVPVGGGSQAAVQPALSSPYRSASRPVWSQEFSGQPGRFPRPAAASPFSNINPSQSWAWQI